MKLNKVSFFIYVYKGAGFRIFLQGPGNTAQRLPDRDKLHCAGDTGNIESPSVRPSLSTFYTDNIATREKS